MAGRAFMNWSGGKDSALALHKVNQTGITVEALVTSVNVATNRVSMHGVRKKLLEAQAASIGLPLHTIELPEMPGMKAYEDAIQKAHRKLVAEGFTHAVFGDIFLEDLKTYREKLLRKDGLECLFPLWKEDANILMHRFMDEGFKAVVVCVNSACLDKSFCGRLLDESFLRDLPANVDPCGENGEYHSFVFDGPIFSKPISITKGEVVFKKHAAPKKDDCFAQPQPAAGFFFQDLLSG